MGTKVQYKSYLPGYYTRDLNEDAALSWPLFYEDAVSNGQFYDAFPPSLLNEYTDFDKEALKQTILTQDAVFRKQVRDLHRLYRRQKELMEEFKQKELSYYALQSQSSLPSSSSLNKFPEAAEGAQKAPHLWDINCNQSSQSGSVMETSEPFKISNNDSRQTSVKLSDSGDSLKKSDMDSKLVKCPRFMIDLQLPANVHADNESDKIDNDQCAFSLGCANEYPRINCDLEPGKNLKLALGSNGKANQGESCHKALRLQDAERSPKSDLNYPVPIKGMNHGASPTFVSKHSLGKGLHEEAQMNSSSFPLHSSSSNMKNFQHQNNVAGPSLFGQQLFAKESERGRHFPPNFSDRMVEPHGMGQSVVETGNLSSFLMHKNTKMESGYQEKPNGSKEVFGMCVGGTGYSTPSSATPVGLGSHVPLSGCLGYPSPSGSSQQKPVHGTHFTPINADATPLFNESIFPNQASNSSKSIFTSSCVSDKFLMNMGLTSNRNFSGEVSSYPSGFLHDLNYMSCRGMQPANIGMEAQNYVTVPDKQNSRTHGIKESPMRTNKDTNPLKNVDLNLDISCDCPESYPSQQEITVPGEPESSKSKLSGGFSWFRSSPSKECQKNLRNAITHIDLSAQDFGRREAESFLSNFVQPPVGSCKQNDCSGGVIAVDSKPPNGLRLSNLSGRSNVIDLEKPASDELAMESGFENNVLKHRELINLNSVPTDTKSSSLQIDLEAPALPDMNDEVFHCEEILELEQFVPIQTKTDGKYAIEEMERVCNEASEAAEIIVTMSSSLPRKPDYIDSKPSDTTFTESLMWFAEVVCSTVDDQKNMPNMFNGGDTFEDFDSENFDYFESMTLKLPEVKPEDLWIKPPECEDTNNSEAGFASLLVGKPKRGQARRRRQKRDFQKDILPGLASLSRLEATDDLQIIGGLMRASGQPWEMGLTRRNAGRGGTSRSRGGRRARGGSSTAIKTNKALPTPMTLPINNEPIINKTNMVGWGTTRRCRRARCPSGNVMPLLPRE